MGIGEKYLNFYVTFLDKIKLNFLSCSALFYETYTTPTTIAFAREDLYSNALVCSEHFNLLDNDSLVYHLYWYKCIEDVCASGDKCTMGLS